MAITFTPFVPSRFTPAFYAYVNNKDLLLNESNGKVHQIAESIAQDDSFPILVSIRTSADDGGQNTTKFCDKIELIGDKFNDTAYISYSDNDYKSFGYYRPVSLISDRCQLRRCGSFRRRAYSILYFGSFPVRFYGLESSVNPGQM